MPLPDPRSRARLAEIGVDVWVRRHPQASLDGQVDQVHEARVRLSAGDGAWLLVQRRPWDGQHAGLLADIQALLRPDRCRFGQWADSREAGLAISELAGRGIRQVLAFGPPPTGAERTQIILVPPLDELASSSKARRALWQALRPRLVG